MKRSLRSAGLVIISLTASPALAQFIEAPTLPPPSLKDLEVPAVVEQISGLPLVDESADGAGGFVKNKRVAILLGKALFWDTQVGSDGMACASCHYHAGIDNRSKNQLNPGTKGGNGVFDMTASGGTGPNHDLVEMDFPFHQLMDPEDRDSPVMFDTDDVVSSAGAFAGEFNDIDPDGGLLDDCTSVTPDPFGFYVNGLNVRRVEPRNTPSMINAVFNFRNFWDGRANNVFNGVDGAGYRNKFARILEAQGNWVVPIRVAFENSSLASQAVGPPLSDLEMSCSGRIWPKIGKKMMAVGVLARQRVHRRDSVLGPISAWPERGLQWRGDPVRYEYLIQQAFADRLWDSPALFDANQNFVGLGEPQNTDQYTLLESNFALFFGLAIQLWESTLISDDTPYDQWAEAAGEEREPVEENNRGILTEQQMRGMDLFFENNPNERALCSTCHQGPTFTTAAFPFRVPDSGEFPEIEQLMERMRMGDGFTITENLFRYLVIGEGSVGGYDMKGTAGSRELPSPYPAGVGGEFEINGCVYETYSFLVNQDTWRDPPPGEVPRFGFNKYADTTTRDVVFTLRSDCGDDLQVTIIDGGPEADSATIQPILTPLIKRPFEPPIMPVVGEPLASGPITGDFELRSATLYDTGFYNIGVRPTSEDPGVGAEDEFGVPMSFTRQWVGSLLGIEPQDELFKLNTARVAAPLNWAADAVFFPDGLWGPTWLTHERVPNPDFGNNFCRDSAFQPVDPPIDDPVACEEAGFDWFEPAEFNPSPVFPPVPGLGQEAVPAYWEPNGTVANRQAILDMPTGVDGAFKTAGLRNVELTGPYFHNGGQLTLRQVLEFYNRGSDFGIDNLGNLSPNIHPLELDDDQVEDVIAFLLALTDERVRCEYAPFDHPEILLREGARVFNGGLREWGDGRAWDEFTHIPATGAGGLPAENLPCLGGFLE